MHSREGPVHYESAEPSVLAANSAVSAVLPLPVLQEQNAIPGRTNILLAHLATAICVGFPASIAHFPSSAQSKCIVTGNPVRQDLLSPASVPNAVNAVASGAAPSLPKNAQATRTSAIHYFFPEKASAPDDAGKGPLAAAAAIAPGLRGSVDRAQASTGQLLDIPTAERQAPAPLVLLVMGGSLGASPLNAGLSAVAPKLLAAHPHLHIIWQTGDKDGQHAMSRGVWGELEKHPRVAIRP